MLRSTLFPALAVVALLVPAPASAVVARIEILERGPVADGKRFGEVGAYELVRGRLHYAVDPEARANAGIVDLSLAPRDGSGRVGFAGDFVLLKPVDVARGNRRLLYGINNRGNLIMLSMLNDGAWGNAPRSAADLGNGFLLEQGYTLLWSAWNWDVVAGTGRLQIELPVATIDGKPITGPVAAELTTTTPADVLPMAWGGSRGYPPADADDPEARLTARKHPLDEREPIPRRSWRFAPRPDGTATAPVRIALDGGFRPGLIYELVYRAAQPRVVGLGLAAIRDAIAFFRHAAADETGTANPLAESEPEGGAPRLAATLVYGFSQSGRVIQHMLLEGLHLDEQARPVFDGAFIHGPGAGKGAFNHRFAQTTRHPSHYEDHLYPADFFPFTTVPTSDPQTKRSAGLLDAAHASGAVPRLVILSAATEYWTRAASLLHTDVAARRDVPPDRHARIYAVAGAQHGVFAPAARGPFRHCANPLDYRPLTRALLLALDAWTTRGRVPPPGAVPGLADGSLGSVAAYRHAFPTVPGLELPRDNLAPPRLDLGARFESRGIADTQPAKRGPAFETRVPLPDADGNDRGGIRLPAVAVPLGSHLGWNLRRDAPGRPRLARWRGAVLPFAATAAERRAAGDPRASIAERYQSEDEFLAKTQAAANGLIARRLLLRRDLDAILARARRGYRVLTTGRPLGGCRYLGAWQAGR